MGRGDSDARMCIAEIKKHSSSVNPGSPGRKQVRGGQKITYDVLLLRAKAWQRTSNIRKVRSSSEVEMRIIEVAIGYFAKDGDASATIACSTCDFSENHAIAANTVCGRQVQPEQSGHRIICPGNSRYILYEYLKKN